MKLQQGQIWNLGDQFVRVVSLERLSVEYKLMKNLQSRDGTHQTSPKKEFCRMIKHAILLTPQEARGLLAAGDPAPSAEPPTAAPDV